MLYVDTLRTTPRIMLTKEITLKRLYHTGLFVRLVPDYEDAELVAEIALHRAVLDRALLDQFHPNQEIKQDAVDWLDIENVDFQEACQRADLDHLLVHTVFLEVKKILKGQVNEIPKNFINE